jgi:FtsZ-interacting cell division protein ZipA
LFFCLFVCLKAPLISIESEKEYITDNFIGHNSLKAWKIENDKRLAEVAAAKEKSAKKAKSPSKSRSPPKESPKDSPKESSDKAKKESASPDRKASVVKQKENKLKPKTDSQVSKQPASPKAQHASRENSPKLKVKTSIILYIIINSKNSLFGFLFKQKTSRTDSKSKISEATDISSSFQPPLPLLSSVASKNENAV